MPPSRSAPEYLPGSQGPANAREDRSSGSSNSRCLRKVITSDGLQHPSAIRDDVHICLGGKREEHSQDRREFREKVSSTMLHVPSNLALGARRAADNDPIAAAPFGAGHCRPIGIGRELEGGARSEHVKGLVHRPGPMLRMDVRNRLVPVLFELARNEPVGVLMSRIVPQLNREPAE